MYDEEEKGEEGKKNLLYLFFLLVLVSVRMTLVCDDKVQLIIYSLLFYIFRYTIQPSLKKCPEIMPTMPKPRTSVNRPFDHSVKKDLKRERELSMKIISTLTLFRS